MAQKANNKMNISYTIRAIDRFTKTHKRLERQLGQLEGRLTRLSAMSPTIDVNVNTRVAERRIDRTKRKLALMPKVKKVWIKVEGWADMDRLATKLRNIDEIMIQMGMGLIWMLIPALGPMLAVAAGGAGALAAQLLGAGAAMGAFALVAVPTIGYLKEIDGSVKRGSKEWYKLSEATRSTLTALDQFRSTWSKLQKEFREPTLEVFTAMLEGADQSLKLFKPTIEGSIEAAKNLAIAFNENLGSADVKGIFEWLGTTAGGYFEDLGKTIGNFVVGFMNMMVAFDPLAQDFADGFLRMSEKFREWSQTLDENKSFQDFMNFTRENGPVMLSFFGSLVNFLVELGIAMAPIGAVVLDLTTRFLDWAEAGLENNKWVGKAIGLFLVWRASMSLLTPLIVVLVGSVSRAASAIAFLWKWGGKLISVFIRILPVVGRVGLTLLRFATGPVGLVITTVITLAYIIYKNWDGIWAKTKEIFGLVKEYFVTKWEEIKDYLKNTDLKTIGADIIRGLIKGISSVSPTKAVRAVARKIKDGFTGFFKVKSPSRLMQRDVGRWITLGVINGMTAMSSKAEREATIVANAIKRPFDEMDTDYRFTARGSATAYTNAYGGASGTGAEAQSADDVVYRFEIPVVVDGREIGRATATYTQAELDRKKQLIKRAKGDAPR